MEYHLIIFFLGVSVRFFWQWSYFYSYFMKSYDEDLDTEGCPAVHEVVYFHAAQHVHT